jgi:hypothetical protein
LSQNTKTTTKTTKIPPKAKPQISYKKQFWLEIRDKIPSELSIILTDYLSLGNTISRHRDRHHLSGGLGSAKKPSVGRTEDGQNHRGSQIQQ